MNTTNIKMSPTEEYFALLLEKEKKKYLYRFALAVKAEAMGNCKINLTDEEMAQKYKVSLELVKERRYKK